MTMHAIPKLDIIKEMRDLPVGSVRVFCQDRPLPTGWVIVSKITHPDLDSMLRVGDLVCRKEWLT